MNREENAITIKHSGNNCCQAVLLAFEDILDLDAETLRKLGAGFGLGMGTMDATCGALCGAEMVLGLKKFEGASIGAAGREMFMKFRSLCGSTDCGDLKGTKQGPMLCSCDDCVKNAVKITEEML